MIDSTDAMDLIRVVSYELLFEPTLVPCYANVKKWTSLRMGGGIE